MERFTPAYGYKTKDYTLLNMRLNGSKQILTFKSAIVGNRFRILLTNDYNHRKMLIKYLRLTINGNTYDVTVDNKTKFTMQPYAEFYSDEITINETDFEEVIVSCRFGLFTKAYSASDFNNTTTINSKHKGRFNRDMILGLKTKAINHPHLQIVVLVKQVEIYTEAKSLAFFGDSLINHSHYTQPLQQRLIDRNANISIVNAGHSGNRLLNDGRNIMKRTFGLSGLQRIHDDVFEYNTPDAVYVALGINDLIHPGSNVSPVEMPTFDEMVEGYLKLLSIIRRHNAKAIIATITPFQGFRITTLDSAEPLRLQLNEWIRNQKDYDLVVDIDRIVRDDSDPAYLADPFKGDDNLHWTETGGKIISDQIDLDALIDTINK